MPEQTQDTSKLTKHIFLGMLFGGLLGIGVNEFITSSNLQGFLVDGIFDIGGQVFVTLLRMIVVPVVFISLVCGVSSLNDTSKLGRLGIKTLALYILTTAIAISLGLGIALLFDIGHDFNLVRETVDLNLEAPGLKETIINLFPANPLKALAEGEMIQIIVFALLLGTSLNLCGESGVRLSQFFNDFNDVVMQLIALIMAAAPYGVFCLIARLFSQTGFSAIGDLFGYFVTVLGVLFLHWLLTNTLLLTVLARLNPVIFFKKITSVMLFAFSTSSSNATIPVTLRTVEKKLGVDNRIAAFTVPLGATINMDGTAIMQGVATVFIANAYQIDLGITQYMTIIAMATLASIGTAGVPGVGMITLAMVLQQVGIPVEGIALIIGIDRILDMVRTAINVTGDASIACVIAKQEGELNHDTFTKMRYLPTSRR